MVKKCRRGEKRGPDGECYSPRKLKALLKRGAFKKSGASFARDSLGKLESNCSVVGGKQRVRVCVTQDSKPGRSLDGPRSVCQVLRGAENADRESFYVLYLDSMNRVNGVEEAHKGTVAAVEVHPREVFKGALAANATAIILAHNHPSGNPVQSRDDIRLTERLVESGKLLGVPVLDHVIVARDGCTSIRENHNAIFSGIESLSKRNKE
jgi:DNA repair protein RadC